MVVKAGKEDYLRLLKFENSVFKINFKTKVPKVYCNKEGCAELHGIVKSEGEIIGGICLYPSKLFLPSGSLQCLGVGSVATDKKHRGKGVMKELMEYAHEQSIKQSADFGILSGYRKRYERYGYVVGGVRYIFELSDYCISHGSHEKISFEKVACAEDAFFIERLYNSLPTRFERRHEEFYLILHNWNSTPYIIKNEQDEKIGYLIHKAHESDVSELVLLDNSLAGSVLACFAKKKRIKNVNLWATDFQRDLIFEMLKICNHYRIEAPESFKIFNFKNVIEKMLNYKLSYMPLTKGSLVLKIENEVLKITVGENGATVFETDEKPQLEFSKIEATIALTRPEGGLYGNALFSAWSPLCPLSIFAADTV